eukprot:scaffold336636_cov53-Attheya_sp.AAC.2
MHISSITLAQMTDYLASEQVIADTRRDKNPRGRGSTGRNNHNGSGYNPGRGCGYQGRSYQGRGHSSSNKCSSSWTPSNNSRNEAKNDTCRYHGFTPRAHVATGRGRGGYCGGRGNGGDRNDAYQNEAATNANSNNKNAPSAASTVINHTNASGWGSGNQSAKNAAADNHWIDSVGAPE